MEDMILKSLPSIGFPAALSVYLLVKMNGTLEKLTEAINKLSTDVEKRLEKLEDVVAKLERREREGR